VKKAWWEISDDSRGGIPYYYHTKTGETMGKTRGFCHTINSPSSTYFVGVSSPSKLLPIRIPSLVAASQSHFPQPSIISLPHIQRDKGNVPLLTVHVHIRKRPEALFKLLVGCTPVQVALSPPQRTAQTLPLCDITLLPIPTTQHRHD